MNRYDIENIEPKELLFWFKKICEIPHGSYHEKQISDWLTTKFKELGCDEVKQYPSGMILCRLKGTKGYEKRSVALLQGHMDMVLAKTNDCPKDLTKEHIDVYYDPEKEWVTAQKTTLGGDNGIAVASMLAIAADKNIAHGPLEFLITVNEEDLPGKCIVEDLPAEDIKSSSYYNLDGGPGRSLIYGAAGCITAKYNNPVSFEKNNGLVTFHVEMSGLRGGHSGVEIHKPHINGICWLAEALLNFCEKAQTDVNIVNFFGGPINNAIPVYSRCDVQINEDYAEKFDKYLRKALTLAKKVAQGFEPTASITITRLEKPIDHMMSTEDTKRLLATIACCPNKVFTAEKEFRCMYSSSNLGLVEVDDKTKTFKADYKIRSFLDEEVDRLALMFRNYMSAFGWPKFDLQGRCWSFVNDPDSNMAAQAWANAYKKVSSKEIIMDLCAGGLELTEVCKKKPDLMDNAISVGATVLKEHSPDEAVPIADLKIYWDTLKEVLKTIN